MSDIFGTASQSIDEQKKQVLAAQAAGGQTAVAALNQSQTQVAALRDAALKQALSQAIGRGAPGTAQQVLATTIQTPYDRTGADLAASQALRAADFANLQAATSGYFGKVAAAVPFARADARNRELDRIARESRARTAAASGGELSDSELRNRLVGAARSVREEAKQNEATARATFPGVKNPDGTDAAGLTGGRALDDYLHQQARITGRSEEEIARELGINAGLDPALVYGVVPNPPTPKPAKKAKPAATEAATAGRKIGLSEKSVAKVRTSSRYADMVDYAAQQLDDGYTPAQVAAAIRRDPQYRRYPKTLELVILDAL